MERRFIKDRQREGIARAKAAGVYQGGTGRLDRRQVRAMAAAGEKASSIAKSLGCSRMQVYRILRSGLSCSFSTNQDRRVPIVVENSPVQPRRRR